MQPGSLCLTDHSAGILTTKQQNSSHSKTACSTTACLRALWRAQGEHPGHHAAVIAADGPARALQRDAPPEARHAGGQHQLHGLDQPACGWLVGGVVMMWWSAEV